MDALLHCSHCDRDLPRSQFYNDKNRASGLTTYCKAYYAAYYASKREQQKATSRRNKIKSRYNLEWDEYQALVAAGCCICGSMEQLHVDHCHSTGKTRGVLCRNCNIMLGHAKDDPEVLEAAATWLRSEPFVVQGPPGHVVR